MSGPDTAPGRWPSGGAAADGAAPTWRPSHYPVYRMAARGVKIIRAKRQKNFTVMANNVIYDSRLSYRALGLLTYLLSKPDGWETDSERLSEGRKEGRDAIRTAMTELKKAGYLKQVRTQDPATGRWSTGAELTDQPEDGFPVPGVTSTNTPSSQVGPTTGKPTVGYPAVGKPGPLPSTDSKNGQQGLEPGCTLPPDPLRTEARTDGPRTERIGSLTLVANLNNTQQVTSKRAEANSPNSRQQLPIMGLVEGGLSDRIPIDPDQLDLIPAPNPPPELPADPRRAELWPLLANQLTRINTRAVGEP